MKKKHRSTWILTAAFVLGLALVLYPIISDYWNSLHQSYAIATYVNEVAELDDADYGQVLDAARAYNAQIVTRATKYALRGKDKEAYEAALNLDGTGLMGYVDVPSVQLSLPIYHGTEEGTLSAGIGHLEWSSLPVGGVGSHCVLSGHSGLPSAKLFSDLRFMSMGDQFSLCVLNETLTYEVDQILVVEPEDVKDLQLVPGEDYCTLVTCTPYGVNSHRLLVRGKRIEDTEAVGAGHVTNEAIRLDTLLAALLVAIPLLMFLLLVTVLHDKNRMQKAAKHGGKSS